MGLFLTHSLLVTIFPIIIYNLQKTYYYLFILSLFIYYLFFSHYSMKSVFCSLAKMNESCVHLILSLLFQYNLNVGKVITGADKTLTGVQMHRSLIIIPFPRHSPEA